MTTARWMQFTLATLVIAAPLAAQGVSVSATNPNAAAQGTINLNVTVSGKGFKNGAASRFFVTGSTNPGGVVVHSTAFVNSTTVVANIDVMDTAVVSGFDVEVDNPDGHSGKGSDVFSVIAGGANSPASQCTIPPLPPGIQLVATLNPATGPLYSALLGKTARGRLTTVLGQSVILVAAGGGNESDPSHSPGAVEVFFLDPVTGAVKDGTWAQPHLTLPIPYPVFGFMIVADVNGDGVPDLIASSVDYGAAWVHLGQGGGANQLSFLPAIVLQPSGPNGSRGGATAVGDLNGDGINEIAWGLTGGGTGKNAIPGKVFLFRWNGSGFTNYASVTDPENGGSTNFGGSVAIGDVTGDSLPDLVVGAKLSNPGNITEAGRAWVYPGTGGSFGAPFYLAGGIKNDHFGQTVGIANLTGAPAGFSDLLVFNNYTSATPSAKVYAGPVTSTSPVATALQPAALSFSQTGLDMTDLDGDQLADVIAGSSNVSCSGLVSLFFSGSGFQPVTLYGPVAPKSGTVPGYGWAASWVPGTRIVLVGDKYLTVNGVAGAGQVYVYKLN